MSTKETSFVVVPFNMLPSESRDGATPEDVEEERQKIRDRILLKSNQELMDEDAKRPDDDKAIKLLRALGSDLNINAFACNFRLSDGTLNQDVEEANYLNKRIVERLSVDEPGDDPTTIPFFLTSTEFTQTLYGDCSTNFKKRLGLTPSNLDLFVLRNVVMSPFQTERKFISNLARVFQTVVEEEVEVRYPSQSYSFWFPFQAASLPAFRSVASVTRLDLTNTNFSCTAQKRSIYFTSLCSIWPIIVANSLYRLRFPTRQCNNMLPRRKRIRRKPLYCRHKRRKTYHPC